MAVDLAGVVGSGVVVVGTEVVVVRCGFGQKGMDDREDSVAHGHLGLGLAPAFGQAAVAGAEACLGPPGGDGGLAEHTGHVTVALAPGVAALSLAGGLLHLGAVLRPRHQVGGGGEHAHVYPDLGDQVLGGGAAQPGDAVELGHLALKRGDEVLHLGGQLVDLGAQVVDVVRASCPARRRGGR